MKCYFIFLKLKLFNASTVNYCEGSYPIIFLTSVAVGNII